LNDHGADFEAKGRLPEVGGGAGWWRVVQPWLEVRLMVGKQPHQGPAATDSEQSSLHL